MSRPGALGGPGERSRKTNEMAVGASALLLLLALSAPAPAEPGPFEVVTRTGQVLPVTELADTPGGYLLRTPAGGLRLAPDSLDFYATYRLNHEHGRAGNVLWFRSGRWMRFEKLEFEPGGRLKLHLGGEFRLELSESVVDFRATVMETGPTVLPRGRGASLVARSTGPPPPERPSEPEPVDDDGVESGESNGEAAEAPPKPANRDLGRTGGIQRRRLGDR